MSRVAKQPVSILSGVSVNLDGQTITIKGGKESLTHTVHNWVRVNQEGEELLCRPLETAPKKPALALTGTTRALLNNMVHGVSTGYEKKMELVGVGYRAKAESKTLNLTLGFSHPVNYAIPEGISIETPSQTEIVIKGADKQKVGQVAAEIRAYRPPEPYKGKGVRFAGEQITLKEAKKK